MCLQHGLIGRSGVWTMRRVLFTICAGIDYLTMKQALLWFSKLFLHCAGVTKQLAQTHCSHYNASLLRATQENFKLIREAVLHYFEPGAHDSHLLDRNQECPVRNLIMILYHHSFTRLCSEPYFPDPLLDFILYIANCDKGWNDACQVPGSIGFLLACFVMRHLVPRIYCAPQILVNDFWTTLSGKNWTKIVDQRHLLWMWSPFSWAMNHLPHIAIPPPMRSSERESDDFSYSPYT